MNPTPYKLTPEQVAQLLANKPELTRGASTRAPSPYAKELEETPIGGAFSICSAAQDDGPINNAKQNARNALAALVEKKGLSPRKLSFFFFRPDPKDPKSEMVMAMIQEGAPAKRAPRKAKEEPAPAATESAPA